jgi:F0F1-type ATP synthase assembly protein I
MTEVLGSLQDWFYNVASPTSSWWLGSIMDDVTTSPVFALVLLLVSILCAVIGRSIAIMIYCLIFSAIVLALHGLAPTQPLKGGLIVVVTLGFGLLVSAIYRERGRVDKMYQRLEAARKETEEIRGLLDNEIKWRKASE